MPARKTAISLKPNGNLRRQPTQARAQQTIQTLFKAAAQILDKEGEGGLSTNRVAAAAGFSIGTLYQYFPSKEVLVQAMATRGRDLVLQELERCLNEMEQDPLEQMTDPRGSIRRILRILIQGFAGGAQLDPKSGASGLGAGGTSGDGQCRPTGFRPAGPVS